MNFKINRHSALYTFIRRSLIYTFIQSFVGLAILLAAMPSLTNTVTYISDYSSALADDVPVNDVDFETVTLSDGSAGQFGYTVEILL